MAKSKGEIKGWITVHGVHVPIYNSYTVRGGQEPKAKGSRFKTKKNRFKNMNMEELSKQDVKKMDSEELEQLRKVATEARANHRMGADVLDQKVHDELDRRKDRDWNKDVDDAKRYGYSEQTEEGKKPVTKAEESSSNRQESSTVNRGITNKTTPESYAQSKGKSIRDIAQEVNNNDAARAEANELMKDGRTYEEAAALAHSDMERGTLKGQESSTPDFSKMSYSQAGAYVAAHKKDFGLSDNDDAYMAAYEMKQGTWKMPENSSTESPKLNTKENYRAVKQSNKTATSNLTAEERQYKSDNVAASKADAYNDKLLADFKAGGKDYQRVSMEDYAGTITDFKVAAKRAGVDYEYDRDDDTFYLRKSKQASSTSKTESNAGKRYSTSSANYGNTYTAQHLGEYSISGLKKAYADAPAALKSKIKAEMQKRGYKFSGGKWVKG